MSNSRILDFVFLSLSDCQLYIQRSGNLRIRTKSQIGFCGPFPV
jgi:hypothetical protein